MHGPHILASVLRVDKPFRCARNPSPAIGVNALLAYMLVACAPLQQSLRLFQPWQGQTDMMVRKGCNLHTLTTRSVGATSGQLKASRALLQRADVGAALWFSENVGEVETTLNSHYLHPIGRHSSGRARLQLCAAVNKDDEQFMRRALHLAARAKGNTFPNPAVGCVIVRDGAVVGEGYHPKAGQPHAEVFALRGAGQAAEGATAYVTLEPCNHYGRTPPCSLALLEAKVSRVVVGTVDPNPLVGGAGVARLRDNGVQVDVPCLEEDCYSINADFMKRIKDGR